jgi:flagellar assembly protein FliH
MSKVLSITELADLLSRNWESEEASGFHPLDYIPSVTANGLSELVQAALPAQAAGGRAAPRHFAPDPDVARSQQIMPQPGDEDPIRQAWKAGFDNGVATEKRLSGETRVEDIEAIKQLREEIQQINLNALQQLESRMREAVLALCHQVIDDQAITPDKLTGRIQAALKLFTDTHNEKVIEVSTTDYALIEGAVPAEWKVLAKPGLTRGSIRVVTADGGIEDGPDQWKLALEEAIRTC